MSQPFSTSAPAGIVTADTTYVGRCFFYAADPAALVAAGYDRIKIYKRRGPTDPAWVELTTVATRLVLLATKRNYAFLEERAARGTQYRPSLADSTGTLPDVPQTALVQEAVDITYETLMTVQELKDLYVWGLLGLGVDDDGEPFPDRQWVHYLQYGISKFETKTRVRVLPTPVVEKHDYSPNEGDGYWSFMLDEFPLVSFEKLTLTLPGGTPYEFPASWLQVNLALGVVDVVPDGSELSFPFTSSTVGYRSKIIPGAFTAEYTAGFPLGGVPENIRDIIGKEAISGFLNIAGDLVGGAAVASQSMSVDGCSQSVNTTSSATNAGFGSRVLAYRQELKSEYPLLMAKYKGIRLWVG